MKCRHKGRHWTVQGMSVAGDVFTTRPVEVDICGTCYEWLPLGPSDETPVAVEIRAAEIAAEVADMTEWWMFVGNATQDETTGWRMGVGVDPRTPTTSGYHAGYLARVIATHGEDQ